MSATRTATPPAAPRIPSPRTQTIAIVSAGAGQNVIYTVVTTFMLLFLLQYADFGPAQIAIATTVIAVTRIVDAIGDPIVGSLIDMTRTRWGKLRPFVLFSAVPVAVLTALLFTVPEGAVALLRRHLRHLGIRVHLLRRAAVGAHRVGVPRARPAQPGRRFRACLRGDLARRRDARAHAARPRAQLRSRDDRGRLVTLGRARRDRRDGALPARVLPRPRARQRGRAEAADLPRAVRRPVPQRPAAADPAGLDPRLRALHRAGGRRGVRRDRLRRRGPLHPARRRHHRRSRRRVVHRTRC